MFAWWNRKPVVENRDLLNVTLRAFKEVLTSHEKEIRAIEERVFELEKVQRTLCDDIYDLQADMTLIHNIEGYEDWREEIGKPVSKPTDIVK